MKFYSTNNQQNIVNLKTAVLESLPQDLGLYMPTTIPELPNSFYTALPDLSFQEIAFEVTRALLKDDLADSQIQDLISKSINFPAPLIELDKNTFILELFHGPSLAFKDFGARFMANLMAILKPETSKPLTILVATSGDTGGAVAAGFYKTPGIEVKILYPSGKVSELQEKQLTTLGHNISAIEIDGTFDDCQAIVKQAFTDIQLNEHYNLSSANSINIARLIPQSFYYFEGYKNVASRGLPVTFIVPSGNFGNITAGIFAKRMGLPVNKFVAATNINKIIPDFLKTGVYKPKKSLQTISNAMDVGNPSNFARLKDIYHNDYQEFNKDLIGYWFNDNSTKKAIQEVYNRFGYVIDPHGAVGYLAHKAYCQDISNDVAGIILETAHPSKFVDVVEDLLPIKVEIPERLAQLKDLKKEASYLSAHFEDFKEHLLG